MCSLAAKKARQCKHCVTSLADGCIDCCPLRDGLAFAHGRRLPEALTLVLNTKNLCSFDGRVTVPALMRAPRL